jgi:hypothetical protein
MIDNALMPSVGWHRAPFIWPCAGCHRPFAGLPALIDNTALQIVPDYRLHGGIAVQF